MNDANPRQQIVDSIKNNNNILVTVSTNPSVDELSAALGLTILLNNLGKRGTAVVSGILPPAITFLEPGKTFESTTDSLRDFIIALDKEKADHLRYKVDGDVVKIFITPYRTQLGEKDLQFSLGDYNVEVVIALGVKDQDHLDKALDAHGAILHDATVVTLTAGTEASTLGSVNWQDNTASSLCEMLVSLSEALKEDKPLLDEQTSTAFLTGIVSATDRFSNDHTTSRVMTMAAQLMAAGANQQLIAAKLQEAHEIGPSAQVAGQMGGIMPQENPDGTMSLSEGAAPAQVSKDRKKSKKAKKPEDGLLIAIDHPEAPEPRIQDTKKESVTNIPPIPPQVPPADGETAEQQLARELADVVPAATAEQPAQSLESELANAANEPLAQSDATLPPLPPLPPAEESAATSILPPLPPAPAPDSSAAAPGLDFEALLPKTEPTPSTTPPTTTNHPNDSGYITAQPTTAPPINGVTQPDPALASVDPFAAPLVSPNLPPLQPDPLFASEHATKAPVAATITPPHAPDEIEYEESPIPDPAAVAAVPDFAAMNPTGLSGGVSAEPAGPGEPPSLDSLPPLPPLPPLPDLSAIPPPPDLSTPSTPVIDTSPEVPPVTDTAPPSGEVPPPPGQFKIPGQ